jgi:ABC-type sugar transport system permease subunit
MRSAINAAFAQTLPKGRPGAAERAAALGETMAAFWLAGPATLALVALFFLPVLAVLGIAFTDWQFGAVSPKFVGIANFREVFADPDFRTSVLNTFIYVLIVVPVTVVLGLLVAILVESGESLRSGPGHASDVLLYTLYRESFEYLRTGYGAAATIVFLLIVITLTLVQARVMDRRVHYA